VADESLVVVGKLGRARGLQGDLFITPMTDFPERFGELEEILVRGPKSWESRRIVASDFISGRPVIRFDGITNPEEASRLTNRLLAVPRTEVFELPEGSRYVFDLIGYDVVGEDDQPIGRLVDVQRYPANDVYVIEAADNSRVVLAAVAQFVRKIDDAEKKITISKAGLVDG
jgi:16S rRNA processing protein RimM